MPTLECHGCGGSMPPAGNGRPRKYCYTCRPSRAKNAPPEPVPVAVPDGGFLTVVDATRAVLTNAGRLNTPMGAAAMVLAEHIDDGEQSGSALSSMVKQLSAAIAEATANAKTEMNPVDELRARRDRKRA